MLFRSPWATQTAVKVRQFNMVRLQCPCPISLWSEAGLNMPILILPNKLNHAPQSKGEEKREGRKGDGVKRGGGRGGGGRLSKWVSTSSLRLPADQDILGGESLIG